MQTANTRAKNLEPRECKHPNIALLKKWGMVYNNPIGAVPLRIGYISILEHSSYLCTQAEPFCCCF